MINNISNVDTHLRRPSSISKANPSLVSIPMPPILGFKTPLRKEKAIIRVNKFKRSDNIVIVGDVDDDYIDIIDSKDENLSREVLNILKDNPNLDKIKVLKNCYVIDYIESPTHRRGLGTAAVKELAEKVMFDNRAEGRIVTYCYPAWKEISPAIFFYKIGFRFMENDANEYIKECIAQKIPDSPPQSGMMYLPRCNLHKLLRYGDVF